MITSFLIAGERTAFEETERFEVRRQTFAVPSVGTGSPLMLMYFVVEGYMDWIPCFLARSEAINVVALPVSGKVLNVKDP